METVTDHVLAAFVRQWPRLRDDPRERAARLARRHRQTLQRPPRAWCVALRAGDTRMTAWNTVTDDCHAIADRRPHRVTVDAALIRRLIEPVTIAPPGEPWTDVAARLGVHEESLRRAMQLGYFNVRHIPTFGGRRGKPVPLLYRPGLLNPCATNFAAPDPAWGGLWQFHADAVPADFAQTLHRRPRHRPYRGQDRFRGWTWTCPACSRQVEMIYLPLPVPTVEAHLGLRLGQEEVDAPPRPPLAFACTRCHRVRYLTRVGRAGWHEFVGYLTAGLLYGREVPMPPWWPKRVRTYRPSRPTNTIANAGR
ncbi:MAG TPA: hypothetical protein VF624_16670 [Tepidisphaeraceae bacterium]|jgi:hypothetical protein